MSFNENLGPVVSSNSYIKSVLDPFKDQLNVAHLNCRSIKPTPKINELRSILKDNCFDLFAISESWLTQDIPDRAVLIHGYNLCRNDRQMSVRGGGVAVYISSGLRYKRVFSISVLHCESLFIEVCIEQVPVLFGVVYLPTGNLEEFEFYHRNIFSDYVNIVVMGDFNCNMFNTSRVSLVRSLCDRYCLSVVHNSKPTHFDLGRRSTSLIDFMLVSDVDLVTFSDQVQCPSVSDHALIFSSLSLTYRSLPQIVEYRDYNNIDWDDLVTILNNFDSNLVFNVSDVDLKCFHVHSLLNSLFSCVPIVRKTVRCDDESWMQSREICFARSLRDLSFSAFQSNRSDTNWKIYCKHRNRAKRVIRRARANHFSRLFDGMDSAGVWRVLKNSGCAGNDNTDFEADVDILNDFFVSGTVFNDDVFDFEQFDNLDSVFSFRCINELELSEALNKVKSRSIGVDGLPINFIKLVFPYVSGIILDLVNCILTSSKFPAAWKDARVVPIPKAKVIREANDLRPISILPALSKVVEHVIKEQILQCSLNRISDSQYAFRQGHNTSHLLLKLTDSIREDINEDRLSILISLDLSKAFNSINYVSLLNKLHDEFSFSKSAAKLIYSYLTNRSQFVFFNGRESNRLSLHSGVPQGSVLGPLLFILYVNDLQQYIDPNICRHFMFADDIFLLFDGNYVGPQICQSNINSCLGRFSNWAAMNSLAINPTKTKALIFGLSNRIFPLNIYLEGEEIEFVSHHRCLGIVIDSDLSFKHHIDALSGKVWSSLRRLYSTNLYLPIRVRFRVAHAILMSQVIYGLEIFSGTIGIYLNRLKRIVNTITRFVYSVPRRSRISSHLKRFLGCSFDNFLNLRSLLLFFKVIKTGKPLQLRRMFVF